jgi:peptidoglycan lytic transglycosylase
LGRKLGNCAACAFFAFFSACAAATAPLPASSDSPVPPVPAPPVPASTSAPSQIYRETGIAGWYGKELHGKRTASGEIFDMHGLSAAHRTLPLGTTIRVTNLDNFKSARVRVNDRGPLVRSRFLDLSYGAARELGFVEQGTARVKIETLEAVRDSGPYTVQAASFTEQESARMLKERLSQKFELVFIVPLETDSMRFYRVRVGSYASEERAEQVAAKLTLEGLEPLVLRKD